MQQQIDIVSLNQFMEKLITEPAQYVALYFDVAEIQSRYNVANVRILAAIVQPVEGDSRTLSFEDINNAIPGIRKVKIPLIAFKDKTSLITQQMLHRVNISGTPVQRTDNKNKKYHYYEAHYQLMPIDGSNPDEAMQKSAKREQTLQRLLQTRSEIVSRRLIVKDDFEDLL